MQISVVVKVGMVLLTHFYKKRWVFIAPELRDAFTYTEKENDWIKMINYVDDALYFANNNQVREHFELTLKNKFHLTLMGEAKWNIGMCIRQHKDHIILDQDQYVKNITSRFEK